MERVPTPAAIGSFVSIDLRDAVRSLWTTPIVTMAARFVNALLFRVDARDPITLD